MGGLIFKNISGDIYEEVDNITEPNQYKIQDREYGIIEFHSSQAGKMIYSSYNAIGKIMYSADRIFTNTSASGEILETMGDIFKNNEKIMRDVKTVGDAAVVIQQTQANINTLKSVDLTGQLIEGKGLKIDLNDRIENGQTLNSNLRSINYTANNTLSSLNQWVESHQDIVDLDNRVEDTNSQLNIKEDKDTTMEEKYSSIVTHKIKDYSYDDLNNDVNAIYVKYKEHLIMESIGQSVLGRDIKALILGNPQGANKLLVISGHHAREQHNAPILLKQIEYYCENWDNIYSGESISDIFKNSAIFYIPSINPDGLEICRIGIDSIPSSDVTRIANIKSALEWKIKNDLLLHSDLRDDTDLPVVWSGNVGKVANYTFRNKDMHMWKSNANGVDLHYNCWEDGFNGEIVKQNAINNGWRNEFASENYIGAVGMSEPENVALKKFIEKYGLKTYSMSYHGKGPTIFWNYNQKGKQVQRNQTIIQDMANNSNTVYSESNNGQIGFAGYMYSKQGDNTNTFSCINETGWGNEKINQDNNYVDNTSPYTICPLDDWQLEPVWKAQKQTSLLLLTKYARRQDLKVRHIGITEYDLDVSKVITTDDIVYTNTNSGLDGVLVNKKTGIIEQWGVSIFTFDNTNRVDKTITLKKPFTSKNFGGYGNCYTTSDVIKGKNVDIKIERSSLTEIKISVLCESSLSTDIPINWCIKGI